MAQSTRARLRARVTFSSVKPRYCGGGNLRKNIAIPANMTGGAKGRPCGIRCAKARRLG
jgi:hypothetical protein